MRSFAKKSIFILSLLLSVISIEVVYTIKTSTDIKQNNPPITENGYHPHPVPPPKIVIDPGHGGNDSGVDKGHVTESVVTLDIADKLNALLKEKSYDTVMTRESDISLAGLSNIIGTNQQKDLNARTNIINSSGAQLFVSIHVNSYPQHPEMSGSIVYYNPSMPESIKLAECIQKQLNAIPVTGFKRDTNNTQQADFYLLRNSVITGVLVETAFITNSHEYKLLQKETFRSQLAKAIADGIQNYLLAQ